jgi:hypothetical protein
MSSIFSLMETVLYEVVPMNFSFANPKSIRHLHSRTPEQGMQKVERDFESQMDGALATFWQTERQKCCVAMPDSCKFGGLQVDFRISSIAAFLSRLHPIVVSASYGRCASASLKIVENRFSTKSIRTITY